MESTPVKLADTLAQRYEWVEELGGGQSVTWLAKNRQSGQKVVVKMLDVGHADDWKAQELFDREVDVLAGLDHPAIPTLLDSFVADDEAGNPARIYLVQEYIEGVDLAEAVDDGFRVDEARARQMARDILEVLSYLHGQQPPVIHRDIKPANIIRGDDGRLHLVDFGAVGRFLPTKSGSTIIGTAGYVPTEQLMGRAAPASDLYALGATLVCLLARRPPAELPFEQMRLRFRDAVNVSDEFAAFLDHLLAPAADGRPQTAAQALDLLDKPAASLPVLWSADGAQLPRKYRPPTGTRITVDRSARRLQVTIPPKMVPLTMVIWCGGLTFLVAGLSVGPTIPVFLLLTAGWTFLGVIMGGIKFVKTTVILTSDQFKVRRSIFGLNMDQTLPANSFQGLRIIDLPGRRGRCLEARSPAGKLRFGGNLVSAEHQWLAHLFETDEDAQVQVVSEKWGLLR